MRTLITAANRVLRGEVGARARRLASDDDDAFTLDAHGEILWRGGPVGRLTAGETMLAPRVEVRAGDFLEGEARERVRQRLQGFVKSEIERRLAPLFAAQALPLSGPARGIVFQLSAALGCVPTEDVAPALKSLDRASRRALARLGVRFGTETAYIEPLLGPDPVRFRALLWAVWHSRTPPKLPGGRRHGNAIAIDPDIPLVILCRDRAPGRCRTGAAAGPARTTGGGGPQSLADWAFCRRCGIGRIGRRRSRRATPGFAGVRLSCGYRRGS